MYNSAIHKANNIVLVTVFTKYPSLWQSGTGKSVTGAHIAYALAMRLRKETSDKSSHNKCVMYCGPSQQSVNVVLGK